ncbi:MAG: acylneuraminate cytidylyltransferase family protein [Candidatus Omnitrophica bacterium]|nr:acylneuraminate cytidylyltransferase family protein [Candidatus Omnitrophota bacterium]
MKELKILALIPARGGSKSIPGKNIVDLGGYPLIAYTIAAARLSKRINRIVVTTDDEKIAGISRRSGAETPFLRPKSISGDKSLDIEFFDHAIKWLAAKENYSADLIVHLRPTTPLRDPAVIDKAIEEIIKDRKASSLRSAEIIERESPYKLFRKDGNYYDFFGREDFKSGEEYYNYPRQRFPATYQPNGYVDIILPEVLLKSGLCTASISGHLLRRRWRISITSGMSIRRRDCYPSRNIKNWQRW